MTLIEAIRRAAAGPSGITFIQDDDTTIRLAYREILAHGERAAALLAARGVTAGDRVILVLPTAPEFMASFYGTILAGAIPVPLSMPAGFGSLEAFAHRLRATVAYLDARHLVTTPDMAVPIAHGLPQVQVIGSGEIRSAPPAPGFAPIDPTPEDLAFIQCTSGSTGAPKGVMLTHANLIANARQIERALDARADDVLVSWLPLNHDMGLIGAVLFPTTVGFDTVLMSPSKFQRRPAAWLQALSRHRGTISTAPNFAYGYVTARARDEELVGLDLSSWRHAFCGAEPIDQRTLQAFIDRFRPLGLRPDAVEPCYGLAEASLAVTFDRPDRPFGYDVVDRQALADGKVATGEDHIAVVSCGVPVEGTRIRIVDAAGAVLPEGRVGRIHVSGPSVMKGYYALPEETAAVLRDGWLDTGDNGYLMGGELRVTGRVKDLIILRGKKYHPSDFEWAAEQAPGVRIGTAVAFSARAANDEREMLYLVCESSAPEATLPRIRAEIITKVSAITGLRPDVVSVTPKKGSVPKTTSGKIQRHKVREIVLGGGPASPWTI